MTRVSWYEKTKHLMTGHNDSQAGLTRENKAVFNKLFPHMSAEKLHAWINRRPA